MNIDYAPEERKERERIKALILPYGLEIQEEPDMLLLGYNLHISMFNSQVYVTVLIGSKDDLKPSIYFGKFPCGGFTKKDAEALFSAVYTYSIETDNPLEGGNGLGP